MQEDNRGPAFIKRRIHVVCSNRWNSAITEYSLSLAQALSKNYDVVFTPQRGSPAEKRALKAQLKVMPLESFRFSEQDRFRYLSNTIKPHFTFTFGGQESLLLSFKKKDKHECWVRVRGERYQKSRLSSKFFSLSHRKFDGFLTPCDLVKKDLLKVMPQKKIRTIALGLSSEKFYFFDGGQTGSNSSQKANSVQTGDQDLNNNKNHKNFMIFGRLDPVKGHENFFKIFKTFTELYPHIKAKLIVAGREENIRFDQLLEIAQSLGISKHVVFKKGTIEHLSKLLAQADVGVISSLDSEVICRVAQEFLLTGTKILVSGAGATEEVLLEPSFGASYRGKSAEETASLMADLVLGRDQTDPTDLTDIIEQRRQRAFKAKEHFSLEAMRNHLESYLGELSIFSV